MKEDITIILKILPDAALTGGIIKLMLMQMRLYISPKSEGKRFVHSNHLSTTFPQQVQEVLDRKSY